MEQTGITLKSMDKMRGSSINICNINEADEQHCRDIVIFIEEMRRQLPPPIDAECSIYRVPKRLLNMNRKAYTPQVISIGPFHHSSQPNFMSTEQHKLQALDSYRRRVNMTIEDIVRIAQNWENKARSCYSEPIKMNNNKFVAMLLLDGCFIVEFLIQDYYDYYETQNGFDSSFCIAMFSDIYRDITLLENQLPFFVLQGLFDLIQKDETENISLVQLTDKFFSRTTKNYELPYDVSPQNVKHLVDFLSLYFFSPHVTKNQHDENNRIQYLIPPSVTELCEAGVTIKKAKKDNYMMDISFKNGVLEILPLDIDDYFEIIVRNLMAFEQYPPANYHGHAIQYVFFLDDLISTEKDVRLLVEAGIIVNNIGGSDKEVSRLFNDLCKHITFPSGFYYLNDTTKRLRDYCEKWWPRSKATLRREYFNSPWAYVSVAAAAFIIILTLLQTIFTAKSTFN